MGSRGCDEYGKGWEKGDPVCLDCPDEYSCRDRTMKRKRILAERRKTQQKSSIVPVGGRDGSVYSYSPNPTYLLPADGEPALRRLGFNILAQMLAAFGREFWIFFEEWRWPWAPPKEPQVVATQVTQEEPKPKSKPKPKPKPKPRPAKRIEVEDFDDDDELDIDLDDL